MMQVARVQKMLGDELGTASNIKSRVNRQSVLGAITSAQQRLKLYNKVGSAWQHGHGCQPQDVMKQRCVLIIWSSDGDAGATQRAGHIHRHDRDG